MLSRHFYGPRVMCRVGNHKLLTFVIVIQPLLWLQGIDRLKWFNNHIGVGGGGVAGKRVAAYLLMGQCYFWREAAAMLVFSSCWGVKKNKPQKTRCRSLVNFDGRWVGRAEGIAGSVTSYWLRDLTCCIRPVLET